MMDTDALADKLTLAASKGDVTPSDEDMLDDYILLAHQSHDVLVEKGGRPTRKVLKEPAGTAIYGENEIRIMDEHGELECTVALNDNLTVHHWIEEARRFERELDRWNDYRQDYQRVMEHIPLLKIPFHSESEDKRLVDILVRLNDWRGFQHHQQKIVDEAAISTWQVARMIDKNIQEDAASDKTASSPELQIDLTDNLGDLARLQQKLETSRELLTWINSQTPDILSEACVSLGDAFFLQRQLESKLEQQANAFYQELTNMDAKPYRSVQYPSQSAHFTDKIQHWGFEISRLIQEHWEWKIFLKWRRMQPHTSRTANIEEQGTKGRSSDLQIWTDYVAYRQYQLERTRMYVRSWQRVLEVKQSYLKVTPRDRGLWLLKDIILSVRARLKKFQGDIHSAELQLQLAEQKLAELSSQLLSGPTVHDTEQGNGKVQLPLSPPNSESTHFPPEDTLFANPTSSPTELRRMRGTPITGISNSVQLTSAPNTVREALISGTDVKKQPITHKAVFVPDQVIAINAIQVTDAPDHPGPTEVIEDGHRVEPKDTLMTDVEVPVNVNSSPAPKADSKSRSTRNPRKSLLPVHQAPEMRKTRFASKSNMPLPSKVFKNTSNKPAKKAKAFTEQQAMALLSAPLGKEVPVKSPPFRRSQRLKERAAAESANLGGA